MSLTSLFLISLEVYQFYWFIISSWFLPAFFFFLSYQLFKEKLYTLFLFFVFSNFYLFWLPWVFIALVGFWISAIRGYSSLRCVGFSLQWPLWLWNAGSRHGGFGSCGSWALERGLSSCVTRAQLLYGPCNLATRDGTTGRFPSAALPGKAQEQLLVSVILHFFSFLYFMDFPIFIVSFILFWVYFPSLGS